MDVEGIDPVAVYAALMSTLVRTVFASRLPPRPGPARPGSWTARRALPGAAELLADAAADLLAFTAFPKEHWRQTWSKIPRSG